MSLFLEPFMKGDYPNDYMRSRPTMSGASSTWAPTRVPSRGLVFMRALGKITLFLFIYGGKHNC